MSFEITNKEKYLQIFLFDECKGSEEPNIYDTVVEFFSRGVNVPAPYIIVDCHECTEVKKAFLFQLAQLVGLMKTSGGMRLIGANKDVKAAILENALGRVLIFRDSLRGALIDFNLLPKEKNLDAAFVDPFLSATIKVFSGQFGINVVSGKPFVKQKTDKFLLGDASGLISITSETFSGTLSISLTLPFFNHVASVALGKPKNEVVDSDVEILGEIANMVLGMAKENLGEQGYSIQAALPTCIYGGEHKIYLSPKGQSIVVPFEADGSKFHIEILKGTSINNIGILKKVAV